jgi:branched-subunit amino acid transport protein
MNEAALIAGMALVTFLIRYPLLALVGRVELPRNLMRALRFVPVAVLTAITVPAVLLPQGGVQAALADGYIVAALVAALVAWWRQSLLLTIVLGMAVFFAWRLLLPGV